MYFFLVLAFLVKFPMYRVHLWLPKAHVEAPVAGSMILAGVLLKLGGYGMYRVLPHILIFINYISEFLISLSILGGVYVSLLCLRQFDMKSLVAYSSVLHIGICIIGLFSLNIYGLVGAYVIIIGHGFCSSGLFFLVNVLYSRSNSRSIVINKGVLNIIPRIRFWWFIILFFNISAPPSINLLGEIYVINSLISWGFMNIVFLFVIFFFSVVYSIYLIRASQHGKLNIYIIGGLRVSNLNEHYISLMHFLPINLFILISSIII